MSTSNLERVRKVKTRHQRLYTRVVTVREELQRFLEDDDDMMKMCLTRKKELERLVSSGHGEQHRSPSLARSLPVCNGGWLILLFRAVILISDICLCSWDMQH